MPKTHSKQVKKGKFKMALFFLVVTCFIWFLSKFSKDFTATVEASINYINLPNNTVLAANNVDAVSFDLTSSGFDFLSYKFKKPKIAINVTDYLKEEKSLVNITNKDLIKIITSELNSNIAVKNISVNEIKLKLDTIVSKEIPLKFVSDITFKNGFKAVKEITLDPKTIIVSGPSKVIDSIVNVLTKPIKYELLSNEVSGEIEIEVIDKEKVSYSKRKVSYTIIVEEFTQKTLEIPITIKNLPIGTNIKLIPEVVSIAFDVSITKFNSVSEKDFTIICDFNERNIEESYLTPELDKKSILVQNVLLQNNRIEYLIFK